MSETDGRAVCDFCGRTPGPADTAGPADPGDTTDEPDIQVPLTWTVAVENGRRRRFCDECSRRHLRAMEAKLDSEWW